MVDPKFSSELSANSSLRHFASVLDLSLYTLLLSSSVWSWY